MPIDPPEAGHNVVPLPVESRDPLRDFPAAVPSRRAAAGGPDDPRMQEAMRLMEAFLAIEDAAGRDALIVLAERLVTHDWARNVQQR